MNSAGNEKETLREMFIDRYQEGKIFSFLLYSRIHEKELQNANDIFEEENVSSAVLF